MFKFSQSKSKFRIFGLAAFDPDVELFKNRILVKGATISDPTFSATNQFVVGLKSDGIWDLLLDIGIFVGSNLDAALVRLKIMPSKPDSYTNYGYTNSDYSEAIGIQGGNFKYLDTNINPSEIGFTAGASFYLREPVMGGSSKVYLGSDTNSSSVFLLGYLSTGSADEFRFTTTSTAIKVIQPNTAGFFSGNRISPSLIKLYKNGASINQNTANENTTFLGTNTICIAARNIGSGADLFLDKKYSFSAIHKALNDTQTMLFYNRVQQLQQALGRAI